MQDSLQEKFWAGEFGDRYVERNDSPRLVASNIALFSQDIATDSKNRLSVRAQGEYRSQFSCTSSAFASGRADRGRDQSKSGRKIGFLAVCKCNSQLYYDAPFRCEGEHLCQYDIVFTKGVLIHQSPELLTKAYDTLYQSSRHYIMVCEYYNPSPVEIEYRGNKSVLFKRDFAGELLDRFPDLLLLDYGFAYHRDSHFPGDDLTWFLMEKR